MEELMDTSQAQEKHLIAQRWVKMEIWLPKVRDAGERLVRCCSV